MADQGNATVRIRKVSRQNPTVQTAERAGHAAGHGLREVEINQRQLLLLPSHRLLFPSLIFTLDSLSFSDLEMATQNVDVREYDCLGVQLGFPSGRFQAETVLLGYRVAQSLSELDLREHRLVSMHLGRELTRELHYSGLGSAKRLHQLVSHLRS